MKIGKCRKCYQAKGEEEFPRTSATTRASICRDCQTVIDREKMLQWFSGGKPQKHKAESLWEGILYDCLSCKRVLPDHHFPLTRANKRGVVCQECRVKSIAEKSLRWHYGISQAQYEALLEEQGGVCAICHRPEKSKNAKNLSVDHDHVTGKVRGLLCSFCNHALGYFRDDITALERAIDYLKANAPEVQEAV